MWTSIDCGCRKGLGDKRKCGGRCVSSRWTLKVLLIACSSCFVSTLTCSYQITSINFQASKIMRCSWHKLINLHHSAEHQITDETWQTAISLHELFYILTSQRTPHLTYYFNITHCPTPANSTLKYIPNWGLLQKQEPRPYIAAAYSPKPLSRSSPLFQEPTPTVIGLHSSGIWMQDVIPGRVFAFLAAML